MAVEPIITFKAGKCDADFSISPPLIKPVATPGFLYLYNGEDELLHFCWRERAARLSEPELDLVMIPTDGTFKPYLGPDKVKDKSPVNGRVFVLRFTSSPQRHLFWLQSRERPPGQPNHFSARDLKLGDIVDTLLQGEELNPREAIESIRNQDFGGDDDGDATMEDAVPDNEATGGAGADATGGDVRDEGEDSREGGADGARAAHSLEDQTSEAVRQFINSLDAGNLGAAQQQRDEPFTTLTELLNSSTTIPLIDTADSSWLEELLVNHLPPTLLFLEHQVDDALEAHGDSETVQASAEALSDHQKRDIIKRVLRSPQFFQGLVSLTTALRNGGLPTVSEALGVEIKNGGYTGADRRIPLSGGEAIEAFVEGIRSLVAKSLNY